VIIQATKKLQDFVGVKENGTPEGEEKIHLWHGNIFMIGRKKCLLLVHNESYYSVFIYGVTKKDVKNLPSIVKKYLTELLRKDDFTLSQIVKFIQTVDEIIYAKTSNKKVMGVMNNMILTLKYYNMTEDELTLAYRLNNTPYHNDKNYFNSIEVLRDLL
jgi:hypothetical protein